MNLESYHMVRNAADGAGYMRLAAALIKISGRDRLTYLQGQISQDVLNLQAEDGVRACLLNGTGHLLAQLWVYGFDDHVVIETDLERGALVAQHLDRYHIREKVQIENITDRWAVVTIQGGGARRAWGDMPYRFRESGVVVGRDRLGAANGIDIWLPTDDARDADAALTNVDGVVEMDEDTFELLRIEAGRPAWGPELSESVIPLEAGMLDAISFSKGCYVGQEIVARIRSRGHTNRSLVRLRLTNAARASDEVVAPEGARSGDAIGRVTSAAVSPAIGPIALGYVRNEYATPDACVIVGGHPATVELLSVA